MDWQQPAAFGVVMISAILLIRLKIRAHRRARQRSCGHNCECSTDIVKSISGRPPVAG